jgi:hypothetical protein
MPIAALELHHKTIATKAAQCTNCMAVATAERSAESVSFQRLQPSHPPTQNVNSADRSRGSACHFGG